MTKCRLARADGDWFFAGSEAGARVVPTSLALAKALGSGIPVGACLVTEKVGASIKENDLGTTFGGGMIAMAAATATLEAIENDGLLAERQNCRSVFRVRDWQSSRGCCRARTWVSAGHRVSRQPAAPIHKALLDRQIITGTSSDPKVLRLLPPAVP